MLIGVPVALALAGSSMLFVVVDQHDPAARRPSPHGRRRELLPAAGDPVLHHGRQPDEHGRHHRAHLRFRRGAGRLDEGRARPRQRRGLGDLRRHVGHGGRRCRRASARSRSRRCATMATIRNSPSASPRASSTIGPIIPPSLPMVHLRRHGQRLDRPAVRRRHHPGPADGGLPDGRWWPITRDVRGFDRDAKFRSAPWRMQTTRAFLPMMTPVILIGGMMHRRFHADRGRHRRRRLRAVPRRCRLPHAVAEGARAKVTHRDGGDHGGRAADRRRRRDLRLAASPRPASPSRSSALVLAITERAVADPAAGQHLPADRRLLHGDRSPASPS